MQEALVIQLRFAATVFTFLRTSAGAFSLKYALSSVHSASSSKGRGFPSTSHHHVSLHIHRPHQNNYYCNVSLATKLDPESNVNLNFLLQTRTGSVLREVHIVRLLLLGVVLQVQNLVSGLGFRILQHSLQMSLSKTPEPGREHCSSQNLTSVLVHICHLSLVMCLSSLVYSNLGRSSIAGMVRYYSTSSFEEKWF